MAWQIPMVNQILPDIKNISIYLRSVKKWGKTTLFRDVIIAKYGDPKKGLLVKCGNESGDTMLDNIYSTLIETYKDLVELGNWLITKKGIEHDIEIVAFDTVDELVLICDKETIARYKEESGKPCKSIKGAFGGFGAGSQYTANNIIKPYMNTLKNAGFGIWGIAHTSMKTIKNKGDLEEDGYQMLTSNLEKNAESAFGDIFDITLTGVIDRNMNTKVKEGFNGKKIKENFVTEEVRKLYFRGTPIIDAGGRFAFGSVPEYMVFDKGNMGAEFIKVVEEGMEKSKTDFSSTTKKSTPVTKKPVEIKADADEIDDEPTDGGLFGDEIAPPTDDVKSLKKKIIDKCKEMGGTKNTTVVAAVKQFGNPNALDSVEKAKEYYDFLIK